MCELAAECCYAREHATAGFVKFRTLSSYDMYEYIAVLDGFIKLSRGGMRRN
jgi:hypothetical protein